jgi:hypothetical protein
LILLFFTYFCAEEAEKNTKNRWKRKWRVNSLTGGGSFSYISIREFKKKKKKRMKENGAVNNGLKLR